MASQSMDEHTKHDLFGTNAEMVYAFDNIFLAMGALSTTDPDFEEKTRCLMGAVACISAFGIKGDYNEPPTLTLEDGRDFNFAEGYERVYNTMRHEIGRTQTNAG